MKPGGHALLLGFFMTGAPAICVRKGLFRVRLRHLHETSLSLNVLSQMATDVKDDDCGKDDCDAVKFGLIGRTTCSP